MPRTTIKRMSNKHGHRYAWDELSKCHICKDCGTAEHRNGDYWWVGRFSKIEPPCRGNHVGQRDWYADAEIDSEGSE